MTKLLTSHQFSSERGFTLMEMLVSMVISTITMAIVIGGALSFRNVYFTDVTRTRINGNLRSGMDIISMNIRQAGENLLSSYPAVLLTDATGSNSDILTLRRGLVPEVLALCADAAAGVTTLYISSTTVTNSECVTSNVAPLFTVFNDLRLADEYDTLRLYIYDKSQDKGEFITFSAGALASGRYEITTSALSRAYTQLNTSIYYIEEYQFSFSSSLNQLTLIRDGYTDSPEPVAFDITGFQVQIINDDATTITSLSETSTTDWKDIAQIQISLTGQNEYKGHLMTSTITSRFFPRNVLSYEG